MAVLATQLTQHLSLFDNNLPIETKKMLLKEKLQSFVLSFIYNHPEYRKLNFYGGTCARIIYGLNRLSEDIDFDNTNQVDLSNFGEDLLKFCSTKMVQKDVTVHEQKGEFGVARWTLKFPILFELGLSNLEDEKLHLKVEVSNHFQTANILVTPVSNNYGLSYVARHFDLPSLMAGKIIACLERVHKKGNTGILVKGRDYYDLIWYMQQQVMPNPEKLKNDSKNGLTVKEAFKLLSEKVSSINSKHLEVDLINLTTEQIYMKNWLSNFKVFFEQYVEFYL
jgi:predicted nucleotidyltransferase component of viral defense system